MLFEITSCEICGNKNLLSVLNLGSHPLCDDLIALEDSRICEEYPIEILFCEKCITAHQKFQVPKQKLFPRNYHYRACNTIDVLDGMRYFVKFCEEKYGNLTDKKILDIGCNDGSLLSFFKEKSAKTYGIEPTHAYIEAIKSGHRVINDFFCEDVAINFVKKFGQPDIITFTNVFAHIEDFQKIIQALKVLLHKGTVIIIENHYLGAILDKLQFDTFYHEHPRTYSCTSFSHIASLLGLNLDDVIFPPRYNGNIRVVYIPKKNDMNNEKLQKIYEHEKIFMHKFKAMEKKIDPWCKTKRNSIEKLAEQYGKLSAKAFPGRAAILLKMLKLDTDLISATYEKPISNKINYYIPGTRIPILSDNQFDFAKNTTPVINLAWHITGEIKSYLQSLGYFGAIIDIFSEQDFV